MTGDAALSCSHLIMTSSVTTMDSWDVIGAMLVLKGMRGRSKGTSANWGSERDRSPKLLYRGGDPETSTFKVKTFSIHQSDVRRSTSSPVSISFLAIFFGTQPCNAPGLSLEKIFRVLALVVPACWWMLQTSFLAAWRPNHVSLKTC